MNNPETAAPDIRYRIPRFQIFPLGDSGDDTIKMSGLAGIFVRYGRGKIVYGFTATGAIRDRKRFGGRLRRSPPGPFIKSPPVFFRPRGFSGTLPGPSGIPPVSPPILPIITIPVPAFER
jgi:hypothetical protein